MATSCDWRSAEDIEGRHDGPYPYAIPVNDPLKPADPGIAGPLVDGFDRGYIGRPREARPVGKARQEGIAVWFGQATNSVRCDTIRASS